VRRTRFGGTQYAKVILKQLWGLPPALDMDYEKRVHDGMREIVGAGTGRIGARFERWRAGGGAGGMLLRNAESARASNSSPTCARSLLLFHEAPSRILISTRARNRGNRPRISCRMRRGSALQ
jgi:phosphoribosylformylglycinamidine (FGAM) synthase-like enzyme